MKQKKTRKIRLRVLLAGNSVRDVGLIRASLKGSGFAVSIDRAAGKRDYVSFLKAKEYDIILGDFRLPRFDSLAALRVAGRERPGVPFIVVSSSIGEETAIRLVKRGAVDYVSKNRLNRLPHAIARALEDRREKEARRAAEEALRESEQRFHILAENSPVGIFQTDAEGRTIYVNPQWCRISGLSREKAMGTGWLKAVHPDDRQQLKTGWEKAARSRKPSEAEYRFVRSDGTFSWVIARAIPEKNGRKKVTGYVGTITDITDRRQGEETLKESESRYRFLFEHNPLPMMVYELKHLAILAVNDEFVKHYGYSGKEATALRIVDIHPPAERKGILNRIRKLEAQPYAGEWHHIRKDGTTIAVEIHSHGITYDGIKARIAVINDVTERKRVETALKDRERRLTHAQSIGHVGFLDWDLKTNRIFLSEEACRIHGIDPGEELLTPELVAKVVHPDDMESVRAGLERAVHGLKTYDIDHRIHWPDGSVRWVHAQADLVKDAEGNPDRLLGTVIDITDRKRGEQALNESEEQYRKLVELLPDALFVNVNTKIVLVNQACCRLLGANDPSELLGKSLFEIVHPDYHSKVRQRRRITLAGGSAPLVEEKFVRLDGTVVDVNVTSVGIEWRGSRGTQVIVRDVTEDKKAGEVLRESQERYRSLFENNLVGVFQTAADGRVLDCNDAFARLFGLRNKADLNGRLAQEFYPTPGDRERYVRLLKEQGQLRNFEYVRKRADGSLFWTMENVRLVRDPDGQPLFLEGTIIDITERKQNEIEIRKLNRIFTVLSNINEAIVRIHDETLLYNEVCRIAVRDGGFVTAWLGKVDYAAHRIVVAASSGQGEDYLREINIDLKDESRSNGPTGRAFTTGKFVVSNDIESDESMSPWRERAGKIGYRSSAAFPITVFGKVWGVFNLYSDEPGFFNTDEIRLLGELAMDISFALEFIQAELDQKRAEESLKKSEELLQSSVRIANIGIFEHDHANETIFWSPKLREIHGIGPDEAVTFRTVLSLVHPEDAERVRSSVQRAHDPSGHGLWDIEYRIVRRDGTVRWVDGRSQTFFQGEGEARRSVRTVGLILDITDRKEAEERLRLSDEILKRVNSLILIADSSGRVTYASPSVKSILGYDPEEVLGDGWWILTHQDKPDRQQSIAAAARGEIPVEEAAYETHVRAKDGKFHWVLWQDARGMARELIGVGQDITDRKQAEEALVLSERKFKDIFDSAPVGIYQSTLEGRFITCNSELARILGYDSADEMLHVDMANDVYYDNREHATITGHSEPQGSVTDLETRWKKKDGTPVWIQLNSRAVRDASGKTMHLEGFVRDITERKQAEERLKENETRRRELELELLQAQKLEGLGTLASGIAHDFNNLLGVIIGHASLLERSSSDDKSKYKKNVDAILKASTRGAGLVKQMLTFARKTDVMMESVMLNDLIGEIVKFIGETFSKTITVETHLAPNLPSIGADVTQVHQVLLNLCVNARDAMPNGGTLTISTGTEDRREILDRHPKATARAYVVLTVSDTGSGMDEETQQRIFEPFFTTKDRGKGSGLGLSLVFGIMESHEGFVTVSSEPGRGTTFHCYFPLPEIVAAVSASEDVTDETIPGGNETILVVEDEEMLRELLAEILSAKGYALLLAEDGEQGIAIYREHRDRISLVLSDLGLPKFGGDELYRRLKEIDPDVRVILSSGYMEPGERAGLLRDGIKEIVPKPYSPTGVLRSVRRVIDGS